MYYKIQFPDGSISYVTPAEYEVLVYERSYGLLDFTDLGVVDSIPGDSTSYPVVSNVKVLTVSSPVKIGGKCLVRLSFEYKGAASTQQVRVAIGNKGMWGFDEIVYTELNLTISQSVSTTTRIFTTDVTLPFGDIALGTYDIYAKVAGVVSTAILDAVEVVPANIEDIPDNQIPGDLQEVDVRLSVYINKATEGNKRPVPATVNANGESFEIGVTILNNGSKSIKLKPVVNVTSATGIDYNGTPGKGFTNIVPGATRTEQFNVARVTPDQAGSWVCDIQVITDDGIIVAQYTGACIIATGDSGGITVKYINKESDKMPFGSTVYADGKSFEIGVGFTNTTTQGVTAGIKVEVTDPNGLKLSAPAVDYAGADPNEQLITEYNFTGLSKAGEWTVKLTLLKKDGTVLDEWSGVLFTAKPAKEKPEADSETGLELDTKIIIGAAVVLIALGGIFAATRR